MLAIDTTPVTVNTPVTGLAKTTFQDNAIDAKIIDANDPSSFNLLDEAYEKLFTSFFPDEVYQEPLEKWKHRLADPHARSKYIIIVTGTNLHDPEARRMTGLSVGIYYKAADSGLLAYNMVDPAIQGVGLGKRQIDMRKEHMLQAAYENGGTLAGGVYSECNEPERTNPENDNMDPRKRLEIYGGRMGGRRVPVRYVCPSGAEACDKIGKMFLLAYPHPLTGLYPDVDSAAAFLRGTYTVRGLEPVGDRDYERMARELKYAYKARRSNANGDWLLPVVDAQGRYKTPELKFMR